MRIEETVIEVLKSSEIKSKSLRLPAGKMDRKLYEKVAKLMKEIGGKWSSAKKAFLFKEDITETVDDIIHAGEYVSDKKLYQFFPTPIELARQIVESAAIQPGERCLEPSAGQGNIAQFMPSPDCIELDAKNRDILIEKGFHVVGTDFLKFVPEQPYDVIVMNPPFAKGQDAQHVLKAIELATRKVVAIASSGCLFRTDSIYRQLRESVQQYGGTITELPEKAFKDSGTLVNTVLIEVEKHQC